MDVERRRVRHVTAVRALTAALLISGCTTPTPSPALPTIPAGATVDCGPLVDEVLCQTAVQVAITAQRNPPPITKATVRRPAVGDDCVTALRRCDATSVIVVLQSGDTLQRVALITTTDGWLRLDLVR